MHITQFSLFSLLVVTWFLLFAFAYPVVPPKSRAVLLRREWIIDSNNAGSVFAGRTYAFDDLEARGFGKKLLAPIKALKKLNPMKFVKPKPKQKTRMSFYRDRKPLPRPPSSGEHSSSHSGSNVEYEMAYLPEVHVERPTIDIRSLPVPLLAEPPADAAGAPAEGTHPNRA